MDVTRILSRQPLARGAAFYIYCLPMDPIVTTGSNGTHPRDGTTVHLSKNASQLLLAARRGPHRPLNRQEGRFYSFSTASQSSVSNFRRFFSAAFPPLSAAADSSPAAALPQPCRSPAANRHEVPDFATLREFARQRPTARASNPPVSVGSQQARHSTGHW